MFFRYGQAWVCNCYWFEDMLGYFCRSTHSTKHIHKGFSFSINAHEFVHSSRERSLEGWIELKPDFHLFVKPSFKWLNNPSHNDPFFRQRRYIKRKKATVKSQKFAVPFEIKPYSAGKKRDNSTVEMIIEGNCLFARILEILEVEDLQGEDHFWLLVREFKRNDSIYFSDFHYVHDASDHTDYYVKLSNVTAHAIFLESNNLPRMNGFKAVVACKSVIGFICT